MRRDNVCYPLSLTPFYEEAVDECVRCGNPDATQGEDDVEPFCDTCREELRQRPLLRDAQANFEQADAWTKEGVFE